MTETYVHVWVRYWPGYASYMWHQCIYCATVRHDDWGYTYFTPEGNFSGANGSVEPSCQANPRGGLFDRRPVKP